LNVGASLERLSHHPKGSERTRVRGAGVREVHERTPAPIPPGEGGAIQRLGLRRLTGPPGKGDGASGVTPPSPPARGERAQSVSAPGGERAGSNAADEIPARSQ